MTSATFSVDVRSRILQAARTEFATHGLAGARIDRIAHEANASKERLYAHFRDKATLFQAVLDQDAADFHDAVQLDPRHVTDFVGAAFDHSEAHPEQLRMLTWARLEQIPYRLPDGVATPDAKVEALREAQRLGTVDPRWQPEDLLELLFSIAHAWIQTPIPPELIQTSVADHRRAAVEAARRLVATPATDVS
ncbi:TetR family transcriptional regulator [uncultured Friedmanniella sp.]|uniref:TetR family transcriptional regulator n=1 Tax=uncultured Friedmanniella sp. TaxID=335381 RepID=UPI0035C9E608